MTEKEFREKYYPLVSNATIDTLPNLINQMMDESLEYGSVCCAIAASALAAARSADKHKNGGITGFQAGAVMWEFIRQWNYSSNKTGLRIIDYDKMLYTHNEDDFTQKTISSHVFKSLQKQAKQKLDEDKESYEQYLKDMEQYKIDREAYLAKYPDYEKNPEQYERLHGGTSEDWDKYHEKERLGFEFAPDIPCYAKPRHIDHWQSIVDGNVPFGYTVDDSK